MMRSASLPAYAKRVACRMSLIKEVRVLLQSLPRCSVPVPTRLRVIQDGREQVRASSARTEKGRCPGERSGLSCVPAAERVEPPPRDHAPLRKEIGDSLYISPRKIPGSGRERGAANRAALVSPSLKCCASATFERQSARRTTARTLIAVAGATVSSSSARSPRSISSRGHRRSFSTMPCSCSRSLRALSRLSMSPGVLEGTRNVSIGGNVYHVKVWRKSEGPGLPMAENEGGRLPRDLRRPRVGNVVLPRLSTQSKRAPNERNANAPSREFSSGPGHCTVRIA
jgi:hypothetical protein